MTNSSVSAATEFHHPSNREQRIAALSSTEELKGLTLEDSRWISDAGTERFVQATANSGQGTKFHLTLPLGVARQQIAQSAERLAFIC